MTILTASAATNMTDWNLGDIAQGSNVVQTLTAWNVTGAGALYDYHFTGQNLTWSAGSNPHLTGGTITGYTAYEFGAVSYSIQGDISAIHLAKDIAHNNLTALQRDWFSGNDTLNGSSSGDHLLGYNGDDTFNLSNGGSDYAEGGNGDDTFVMGASFGATDRIDGGRGADTLVLQADYWLAFTPAMLKDVETVRLMAGHDYILHFDAANVGHGGLTVDATALESSREVEASMDNGAPNRFTVLGGAGDDTMRGGGGRDHFVGNAGNDVFVGRGGADTLTGGSGADVFVYSQAGDSTGRVFDTITDFDAASDKFSLDSAVTGVDGALIHGTLSAVGFNAALAASLNGAVLHAHHAVLYTPDGGDYAGDTFLVIDANGAAGFQGGKDYVIHLADTSHLGGLDAGDFLLSV